MVRAHRLVAGGQNPDEDYPVPAQFGGSDFLPGEDLEEIASALIREYTDFAFLEEMRVSVVWKRKGGESGGSMTLGKCVKPSGLMLFYARADFVIWVAADHAADCKLSRWQIEALLYHELKHASYDEDDEGEKTPKTKGHDVEAFNDEVREYGAWKADLKATAKVFLQLEMDLSEPGDIEPGARRAVQEFVDKTFAGSSIDAITVETGGKTATVRRPETVRN